MEKQEYFIKAKEEYLKTFEMFKKMATELDVVMKNNKKHFDVNTTLTKLDVALQYSLLQMAIADGHLDRSELVFIKELPLKMDFIVFLNLSYNLQLGWDGMFEDTSLVKQVIDLLFGKMQPLVGELVDLFAEYDIATPEHDYLADLDLQIRQIRLCLASVDGDVEKAELDSPCLFTEIFDKIKERKAQ